VSSTAQTLRQLLPWSIEHRGPRPFDVFVPSAQIGDKPRFGWRGAFLDVSRHFFSVDEVKRYIDLVAMYKFNRLHLRLSDDQGWRIQIDSWPNLTTHGGSTEVKGGPGGFYTKAQYAELVAYARDRFILVIPEIDMPSHSNAAQASYPELNCNGVAPPLYTGIDVGFSNFCFDKEITFKFLDDVLGELATMTPGPYLHIGGDEVKKMTPAQYAAFMERAQGIVAKHGKTVIAWDEIIHSKLLPSTVIQYWRPDASMAPPPGTKLILSPANKIYLDMKYDDNAVLGLNWAGNVDVNVPYDWDPATHLKVPESDILGVETAIWSETPDNIRDLEFMLFPRVAAVAELAWTAQAARHWDDFRARLGPGAPLVGARHQRVLVAEGRLAALIATPRKPRRVLPRSHGEHGDLSWDRHRATGTETRVAQDFSPVRQRHARRAETAHVTSRTEVLLHRRRRARSELSRRG
jgi:hexosaminidase